VTAFSMLTLILAEYDVILCDSTDPVGPGVVLFSEEFYREYTVL